MPKQLRQRISGRSSTTKHFESSSIVFLSLPHCYLEPEVTRKRVNSGGGTGLGILTRFRFYGPEKTTQWLETRVTKIKEQLKESVNYYLK